MQHKRVAGICEGLIDGYRRNPWSYDISAKKDLGTDKIIWQYWAQGFDNVPAVVQQCLESVEKNAEGYVLVRLTDDNLSDYLDLPAFVQQKRVLFSKAHFSDILRLMLLRTYGGIWLDATVMLSGPIPSDYRENGLFFFRRDPAEPNRNYWQNTYAYYFGWAKGFRVNMLNSILLAKPGNTTVSDWCNLMLQWWKTNDSLPDYFFFQILSDVYGYPDGMPLVSDTLPHYLQQSINDPSFNLMSHEEILRKIPIHKLTYK
ncbi:MAG: capsular biosynthesis protein [Bacteroidales bacterium]|nr:capsular biosynthesis protein [Bacteroidales bacterium]